LPAPKKQNSLHRKSFVFIAHHSSTHRSSINILFFGFLVLGVLAFGVAEFDQFQLALHRLGFMGDVIDLLASGAGHLHIRFLF